MMEVGSVLMNRPSHRRVLERDWGPGRAVRTRWLAILKRIKIPGRLPRESHRKTETQFPQLR